MDKEPQNLDEITEEKLGFAAITEGLGFHPKNTNKNKMGTGAELAGKIQTTYIPPRKLQDTQVTEQISMPNTENVAFLDSSNILKEQRMPFIAYGFSRFFAFMFDMAIINGPLLFTFAALFSISSFIFLVQEHFMSLIIFECAYIVVYFTLTESFGGQSMGKILFGLYVVEDDKHQRPIGFKGALTRALMLPISILPFGAGIIFSISDSKFRQWHDRVSRSKVMTDLYLDRKGIKVDSSKQ